MELGELKYLEDVRTVWQNEAHDFTPWLAEHIHLLGKELGLDLEVIEMEHNVGAFSLDIYAKEVSSGNPVVIENQLEVTDHTHLGQLLTYAAGVEAKTVIWITKNCREEHRKALDWLNQVSQEDIEFFAVEIEIIQIDQSKPAPFFRVKVSPNEWSKAQKQKTFSSPNKSPKQEYYHAFFTKLLQKVQENASYLSNSKKAGYDSWHAFPAGKSGFSFNLAFRSGDRFSCELYIDLGDKESNEAIFDQIVDSKESIERELGELSWEKLEEKRACRIATYIETEEDDNMVDWGIRQLVKFRETLKPFIV